MPAPKSSRSPYRAQGCQWTLCKRCGARWVEVDGWKLPMQHSPAPGRPPTTTARKYLGGRIHQIGVHKGKAVKDLPLHYLKSVSYTHLRAHETRRHL
eukprot:75500-Prorocentrum_lima.AAC.1